MAIKVVLAETAWLDLDKIYDWIAERADPETAEKYVHRILRSCASLSDFPRRGAPRADFGENIRTLVFEHRAIIAYRLTKDEVSVLRVLHHGRDSSLAFQP